MPQIKRNYQRKFQKRAPRRKRGFGLDVTVGRNVPILGGSSLRLGTRSVKRIVRRELNRQEETKVLTGNVPVTPLGSNAIYALAPQRNIVQGLDDNNRVGKQIFLRHIGVRGYLNNNNDIPEARYRFMCVKTPLDFTLPANTLSGSGPGSTDIFYPPGGNPLIMAMINNKLEGMKVLEDRTITIRPLLANNAKNVPFKFDCKVNEKVTYKGATASGFTDSNYYLLFIPYSTSATAGQTVGYATLNTIVTFQDS